ncbi:Alpha/beta knot methyltransferase [Haematococcus lacustris]
MLCAHSRHRPYSSVVAHRADRARTVQMLAAVAHAREQTAFDLTRPKPVVILVCPSMPENIGSAARAMKNFGLEELRLVSPKDGWTAGAPNALADATAAHAVPVVRAARLFSSAAEAVADLHLVYAATARERSMNKQVVLSRDLYSDVQAWRAQQLDAMGEADGAEVPELRLGLMFGRESSGLTNEEVGLAHKVLTIDAHPGYPVLNLAQAVVLSAYELYQVSCGSRAGRPVARHCRGVSGQQPPQPPPSLRPPQAQHQLKQQQ